MHRKAVTAANMKNTTTATSMIDVMAVLEKIRSIIVLQPLTAIRILPFQHGNVEEKLGLVTPITRTRIVTENVF